MQPSGTFLWIPTHFSTPPSASCGLSKPSLTSRLLGGEARAVELCSGGCPTGENKSIFILLTAPGASVLCGHPSSQSTLSHHNLLPPFPTSSGSSYHGAWVEQAGCHPRLVAHHRPQFSKGVTPAVLSSQLFQEKVWPLYCSHILCCSVFDSQAFPLTSPWSHFWTDPSARTLWTYVLGNPECISSIYSRRETCE